MRTIAAALNLLACAILASSTAYSATYTTVWNFDGADGGRSLAGMKQLNGILYGTTEYGGSGSCTSEFGNGCGEVFSFDPSTNLATVVYSFAGGTSDGELPYSRLAYANGVLYGTTYMGGSSDEYCYNSFGSGCGTVFSIDLSTGTEKVLYRFKGGGTGGLYPITTPVLTNPKHSELFGTTLYGGTGTCVYTASGCGTVFKIDLSTGAETTLYSFQNNGKDAINPSNDWKRFGDKLYSTTIEGGKYGAGAIFSIDIKTGAESVVHSFGKGTDGARSYAGMTRMGNMLYGTTFNGGKHGGGTLFSFDPTTNKETVLYSFYKNPKDGAGPATDLIHRRYHLYGTTSGGGKYDYGTIFSFNLRTGQQSNVYSYGYGNLNREQNNRLVDFNGTFYATVPGGGSFGNGTIYSLVP